MSMRKGIFIVILLAAAWQDYRTRMIGSRFLLVSAGIGIAACIFDGIFLGEIWRSCALGVLLLGISRASGGGIGEGDGWFFVISGMYLNWMENVQLFIWGLILCFCWSLPLAVRSMVRKGAGRKRELPFLPFLVPAGICLALT